MTIQPSGLIILAMAKISLTINGTQGEVESVDSGSQKPKTLLEASKELGVSVAHYCFGNALCSTCRVEVVEGANSLSPKQTKEKVSLNYHLCFDEGTRLACQAKIVGEEPVVVQAPKLFKMIAPPQFGKKKIAK